MKGARPQNDPSSWEDRHYARASTTRHFIFRLGDYSVGQNNCQDLVAAVAKELTGQDIDLGTVGKPMSMREWIRWRLRLSQQMMVLNEPHRHHHRNGRPPSTDWTFSLMLICQTV